MLPLPGHPPLSDQAQVLLLVLLSHLYKSLSDLDKDKDKEKVNFERFRIKNKEKKIEVENAWTQIHEKEEFQDGWGRW